jgi:hypothetical protein
MGAPNVIIQNAKTKMEPVNIKQIPRKCFGLKCYLCQKDSASKIRGSCVNCNAPKCKRNFHITCAQKAGTLQEKVNVKGDLSFIVFCQDHVNVSAPRISINSIEKVLETRVRFNDKEKAKAVNSAWIFQNSVSKT